MVKAPIYATKQNEVRYKIFIRFPQVMWDFTDSILLRIAIGLWNSYLLLQRADPNFLDPVRFMLVTCVFPRLMSAMRVYLEFFSLIFDSDWPINRIPLALVSWYFIKIRSATWKSFGNENAQLANIAFSGAPNTLSLKMICTLFAHTLKLRVGIEKRF